MTATQPTSTRPGTALEVRDRLVEALRLDLVGPTTGDPLATERLLPRERPSTWYVTGFLAPVEGANAAIADPSTDEDDAGRHQATDHLPPPDDGADEPPPPRRRFLPSSMGLSVFVPPAPTAATAHDALSVRVRWGDYVYATVFESIAATEAAPTAPAAPSTSAVTVDGTAMSDPAGPGAAAETVASEGTVSNGAEFRERRPGWQRDDYDVTIEVPLGTGTTRPVVHRVPRSGGLEAHVQVRAVGADELGVGMPAGLRMVSCFLVNRRVPNPGAPDLQYAFQAELQLESTVPFVARPDMRGASIEDDPDERVADLHYARTGEYATGHGVACDWEVHDGACRVVRTAWIPAATVAATRTASIPGVTLDMAALADLDGPDAVRSALSPLVDRYREWIAARDGYNPDPGTPHGDRRAEVAAALLGRAGVAADRIARGIDILAEDPDALDAFRVANRAVRDALARRMPDGDAPTWRAFQLAFILLTLPGIARPVEAWAEREAVDLLFFPTGGGKTEAYLGLAAFTMVLRRLRARGASGEVGTGGAGLAVFMRYTLRLLTLDQLGRAAGLVCALELIRSADPRRYGTWPFEIGLWVGQAATPNVIGQAGDGNPNSAHAKLSALKANPGGRPSPVPLEECPWCFTKFTPESFTIRDAGGSRTLEIRCADPSMTCDFQGARALPIVGVDEPIYRRLPAFLIATVDKFASLPWVGQTGALLGGATRCDASGFYGPSEPGIGAPLDRPIAPPDLVIQDELHLISGPLGTVAGLYETAIDALCTRELGSVAVRPKVVASTATVRQADDQVRALFARNSTVIFPPPGPTREDSFFAEMVPEAVQAGRLYLGVAAAGTRPKELMRRVWLALMGAAQKAYLGASANRNQANPADAYMTVLGYFNSLRDLGSARRILEEEVQNTLRAYGGRRRIDDPGLFADRDRFREVLELTSRVTTDKVADTRRRLGQAYHEAGRVDCAIATNMISVGLDIPRLGLMVVHGQPISRAQYIQATSRVGRDRARPGLVVTILDVSRPRDRSHYERFRHVHETFYRGVEAGSVTPFSPRAMDRALPATLVALSRHSVPQLAPPTGATHVTRSKEDLAALLDRTFRARLDQHPFRSVREYENANGNVTNRIADLLDAWQAVVGDYQAAGEALPVAYQPFEAPKSTRPLLQDVLATGLTPNQRKFRAPRSMRDVEPGVHVYVRGGSDDGEGGE
jgi:hypothetical protein